MFVPYQTVRNTIVCGVLSFCGVVSYVLFAPQPSRVPNASQAYSSASNGYSSDASASRLGERPEIASIAPLQSQTDNMPHGTTGVDSNPVTSNLEAQSGIAEISQFPETAPTIATNIKPIPIANETANENRLALYRAAMKIAMSKATGAQGKDILGAKSPWKLNLYDDDVDGAWDRSKLDFNRDDIDDEKWTYKDGHWEKEGGSEIWNGNNWQSAESFHASASTVIQKEPSLSNDRLALYRAAMKIATSKATGAQGKDVLGARSPWKLNLYDDDVDGAWDRSKLDFNRDDIDDEKWTYKDGHWEKEGGSEIWNGNNWQSAESFHASASTVIQKEPSLSNDRLALYRAAMKIATSKATGAQGKDVLGARSPWKLNLYDDNGDGAWDRGKLDTNRDGTDDEKWNFKGGRWEKENGARIWTGDAWVSP
jgi:hypothetical protein